MKKKTQETTLFINNKLKNINTDNVLGKNFQKDQNKTTNVNILLNRVRSARKENFRKKIIFISTLAIALSIMVAFVIL